MSTKVTTFALVKTKYVLDIGEMAEWSIAAVLKTVEGHTSGGSNPSLSAKVSVTSCKTTSCAAFSFHGAPNLRQNLLGN